MKKYWFLLLFFLPVLTHAWFRLGDGATPVFLNTGQTAQGVSVTVSTSTVKLVYSGVDSDRELLLQNTSASYSVWVGTSANLSATSGPRMELRANQDLTTDGSANIYIIADPAAGGTTIEITGWLEFDKKDR